MSKFSSDMIVPLLLCLMLCLSDATLPDHCTTIYKELGQCISVYNCPSIFKLLQNDADGISLTEDELFLLSKSRCSEAVEYVCCTDEVNSVGLEQLMKQNDKCGKAMWQMNDREVPMGGRTWMALLQYRSNSKTTNYVQFKCTGTLITDRFVLTAALCVQKSKENLIGVRLGEYNVSSAEDCQDTDDCAPPVQDVGIELYIVHEKWHQKSGRNDIALLKLNRSVDISGFYIRPVCLPLTLDLQKEVEVHSNFIVTGWGKNKHSPYSGIPMEARISILEPKICAKAFRKTINNDQLCAGDGPADTCNGDSGGPLQFPMAYFGAQRFVQMGIVSSGARFCAWKKPAIFTNVGKFIPWITQKLAEHK